MGNVELKDGGGGEMQHQDTGEDVWGRRICQTLLCSGEVALGPP